MSQKLSLAAFKDLAYRYMNTSSGILTSSLTNILKESANGSGIMFQNSEGKSLVSYYNFRISGSVAIELTADDSGAILKATYTLTNNGSTDTDIGKALVYGYLYDPVTRNSTKTGFLEGSIDFDPIPFPAGGVAQIVLTFRFDYPQ